jgi:hypothetical protein
LWRDYCSFCGDAGIDEIVHLRSLGWLVSKPLPDVQQLTALMLLRLFIDLRLDSDKFIRYAV